MNNYSVEVLRGSSAILGVAAEIERLSERSGLGDNPLLRVDFFLKRVRLFPGNRPVALLVRSPHRLEGAVYLYERTLCAVPTGYMRGFDHLSGESSVIGDQNARLLILECAIRGLFVEKNVVAAWATVCLGSVPPITGKLEDVQSLTAEYNSICRNHRLKLSDTFAATLRGIGPRTRRNLRYYRRRAESELKATFEPRLTIAQSEAALRALSKRSFQPFAKSLSEWRKMDVMLRTQPGYFAVGLRANGEWISYLTGIRRGKLTFVILQINHNEFERYSLSTVLRSYLLEEESRRGQVEINFVNGVCALFQHCCEPDVCVTLVVRRGLMAHAMAEWIAPWHSAPDHALNIGRWASSLERPTPALASLAGQRQVLQKEL